MTSLMKKAADYWKSRSGVSKMFNLLDKLDESNETARSQFLKDFKKGKYKIDDIFKYIARNPNQAKAIENINKLIIVISNDKNLKKQFLELLAVKLLKLDPDNEKDLNELFEKNLNKLSTDDFKNLVNQFENDPSKMELLLTKLAQLTENASDSNEVVAQRISVALNLHNVEKGGENVVDRERTHFIYRP